MGDFRSQMNKIELAGTPEKVEVYSTESFKIYRQDGKYFGQSRDFVYTNQYDSMLDCLIACRAQTGNS